MGFTIIFDRRSEFRHLRFGIFAGDFWYPIFLGKLRQRISFSIFDPSFPPGFFWVVSLFPFLLFSPIGSAMAAFFPELSSGCGGGKKMCPKSKKEKVNVTKSATRESFRAHQLYTQPKPIFARAASKTQNNQSARKPRCKYVSEDHSRSLKTQSSQNPKPNPKKQTRGKLTRPSRGEEIFRWGDTEKKNIH